MNKGLFAGCITVGLLFSHSVFASGQAQLLTSDQMTGAQERIDVLWDDNHLKMEFPGNEEGFMLAREDGVYTVVHSPAGQIVMDLNEMSQMHGGDQTPEFTEGYAQSVDSFEDTGQTRTVAGIEGAIYAVSWTDFDGVSHDAQAVLTDDQRVVELTQAMQYLGVLDADREDALGEYVLGQGLGVLLFEEYEVASIESASHPSGTFELPAEPMSMEEIMQMMQGQMGGGM